MRYFRDFSTLSESSEFPVVKYTRQPGSSFPKREINSDLDEVTDTTYSWPLAGYEAIKDVLSEHGLSLPDMGDLLEDGDELVFCIDETELYLYLFYEKQDDGKYEFYAEVVNEEELEDVLDNIDVGEEEEEEVSQEKFEE